MGYHYVYIMASKRNGTLYIGVTTEVVKHVWQHKNKTIPGFTEKYDVNILVYYETFEDYWEATNREKRLKNWKRQWKLELIEKEIPTGKTCMKRLPLLLDPDFRQDA
jgi:putative endonuclease